MNRRFYKELLLAFPCHAIIDLTPGEGMLAQAAIETNVMYLGVTMNSMHNDLLQARLDKIVISALLQEDHPMYSPELHAALQAIGVKGSAARPKARQGQKPKNPHGGPRTRKARKPAPAPVSEEEGEDPDDPRDGDDESFSPDDQGEE